MRWSDLLWHRSQRIKATPVGIAAALAEAIVESTNLLRVRLEEEGMGRAEPERFGSDECLLECTIFEWFLRDIVISREFGRHAEAIRRALAGRVLIDLHRSGLSVACLEGFDHRWQERFAEYTEAAGVGESLQALGGVVWMRILGRPEPSERGTMLLARRAIAELGGLGGLGRSYAIVELAPALPGPQR